MPVEAWGATSTYYYCRGGEYLVVENGVGTCAQCSENHYCYGGDMYVYSDTPNGPQGMSACPVNYAFSRAGVNKAYHCYRHCTTDDVSNSRTVTGKFWHGGNNFCSAKSCVAGWILKPSLTLYDATSSNSGVNNAYISNTGEYFEQTWGDNESKDLSFYGITEKNTFAIEYNGLGMVTGRASCSTRSGTHNDNTWTDPTKFEVLPDETGQEGAQYCYCQVDGYDHTDETRYPVLTPWVYLENAGSSESCADICVSSCMNVLRRRYGYEDLFRKAVYKDVVVTYECEKSLQPIVPGTYVPGGTDEAVICLTGSYCPGADDIIDSEEDQGIFNCPVEYPNSYAGATSESDCFKTCVIETNDNSTSGKGEIYYGDDSNVCKLTECVAGWRLKDFSDDIGTQAGINSAYISVNSVTHVSQLFEYLDKEQEYYGISEPGEFAVDYGERGMITGQGRCSTIAGTNNNGYYTNPTIFDNLTDEAGVDGAKYCYCQVVTYTPFGEVTHVLSNQPWVFGSEIQYSCKDYCARNCGDVLKLNGSLALEFRRVVFGSQDICEQGIYRIKHRNYLPAGNGTQVVECLAGYYCPGADNVVLNSDVNQGIVKCPTDYPKSDVGSKTDIECYRDCSTDDIAHSMTVVGRNYYGAGEDTCVVTDCVAGWYLNPELDLEKIIGSTYEGSNSAYMAGTNSACVDYNGVFVETTASGFEKKGQEYYGIAENNTFAVLYNDDKGMITGRARCSSNTEEILEILEDETGQDDALRCYCNIDSYTDANGIKYDLSALWVSRSRGYSSSYCANNCAKECSMYMREFGYLSFRGKVFEASYVPASCKPNSYSNIFYELGGGLNYEGVPMYYEYGVGAKIDGVPTRSSFTFISWCRDPELTDCAMPYEISATESGDITLYAKWQFVCESDKWFHIGEDRMCLYSNKETDKTINFNIDGEVYYLLMSIDPDLRINATSTKKLRMLQNGIIYNGYDWSAK